LNETEYMACIKKMNAFNLNILFEEYKLNLCVTSQDTSLAVIFYNKHIISLDIVHHYIIMDVSEHSILACRFLCTAGYTDHTVLAPLENLGFNGHCS